MTPEQETKFAELQAKVEKAVKEYARLALDLGMTTDQIAEKLLKEANYVIGDDEDTKGRA